MIQIQDVVIGPMTPLHLPQVLEIERASYPDPWTQATFMRELNASKIAATIVAHQDDTVCGYIISWMILEEVHIGNVAVASEFRRQGIGRMMMEWLLEEGIQRGCTFSTLEVRRSNQAAQLMYQNLGFRAVACRKTYYSEPVEDAIVMLKSL